MPTLFGEGNGSIGVFGRSTTNTGVFGLTESGFGVCGQSTSNLGVYGISTTRAGVSGYSERGFGTQGISPNGVGVYGQGYATGVYGSSTTNTGVSGNSQSGFGTQGASGTGIGVVGVSQSGLAGLFIGDVDVHGTLSVFNGNKSFKIDHPLDPQNKYLLHNTVESSERKNVYDGVVQLDEDGAAWVDLPPWFEALNEDFRYQLTAVGRAAPNLHVAEEIYENRFRIAGGEAGMKVCWQVTGSRKDPWAAANPFEVEEEKSPEDRGHYLQPDLYNAPEEQRVGIGAMDEETLRQIRQESPHAPQTPSGFEPPAQAPQTPPGPEPPPQAPQTPSGFVLDLYEENRQQIDELRRQIEELRRQL
jgi:hypothetical protein